MNILHIRGGFDQKLGGTYTAIHSIMQIENHIGINNEVLTTSSDDHQYDPYFEDKIHLFDKSFPKRFSFSKSSIKWLENNITRYDFIVIHEIWSGLAYYSAILAKKYRIKYIIWPHGSLDPFDLKKKFYLKKILGNSIIKNTLRNAHAICCTSTKELELIETYGERDLNIKVLPLPVNYNDKEIGNREDFRKKYNFGLNTLVFLFLLRIDYKKGLDISLKALRILIDENQIDSKSLHFFIAGKGKDHYENYIRKLVSELNLTDFVTFSGPIREKEKADAFMGADLFILPSHNENFGLAIIEALQCGLPIMISKNVYIYKDIFDGISNPGWLCEDISVDTVKKNMHSAYLNDNYKALKLKALTKGNQFRTEYFIPFYKDLYNN